MRFALLGADEESLLLAEAAIAAGHTLAWGGDLHRDGLDLGGAWANVVDEGEQWEDLFDPAIAEAIIVGRGAAPEDVRARRVQELARQGRPLLAVHPLFDSVLTYFEVDMARGESRCVVEHFNPVAESPALGPLRNWLQVGHRDFGDVEQVVATRPLADRRPANVLRYFARDVELLHRIAGPLDRLGAHAGGKAENYSALAVQLSGPREVPVRWAVEPPSGSLELRIVLVCQGCRLVATLDDQGRTASLDFQPDQGPASAPTIVKGDAAAQVVARFVAEVERNGEASTWPEALHSMVLADSIEISLRRGRMIDVHRQELTEHLAFKGTMAALGCGVLVVLVPLMLVAGWIAGQFGVPVAQYWPHALLFLLAAFLGLQVLPKLLYGGSGEGNDADAPPPPSQQ